MKTLAGMLVMLIAFAACAEKPTAGHDGHAAAEPAAETKLYPLTGTIMNRDASANRVTVDHEDIEDFMPAMTMPFPVPPEEMGTLPPDGTKITGTVRVTGDEFVLTEIKPVPPVASIPPADPVPDSTQ